MKDTEFFSQMLGVAAPWYVKAVRVDTEGLRVEVEVGVKEGTVWGVEDGIRAHVHGYERRRWRHLDTMQCETVVVAEVPRLKWVGPDGNERTGMAAVPWAKKSARWTVWFEAWAVPPVTSTLQLFVAELALGDQSSASTVMVLGPQMESAV